MFDRLKNPIPEAIEDPKELRDTIEDNKLIPYYGGSKGTSHNFLKLLFNLYALSPTKGAVLGSIRHFAFGGDIEIVKKKVPGFKSDDAVDIPYDAQIEILRSAGFDPAEVKELTRQMWLHYKTCGNAYLWYREVEVEGEISVRLKVIHPKQWMYMYRESGKRMGIYSKRMDEQYWKRTGDYKFLPVYPYIKPTKGDGVRETVFHLKNETDESDYYGRPETQGDLFYQFAEFANGIWNTKVASTDFTAKAIITEQAADPSVDPGGDGRGLGDQVNEDLASDTTAAHNDVPFGDFGKKSKARELRKLTTNEGKKPHVLAMLTYEGKNSPGLLKLDVNRDSKFMELSVDTCSKMIHMAHNWPRELSSFNQIRGSLGTSYISKLFSYTQETVVRPEQSMMEDFWAKVIAEMPDGEAMSDYSIRFDNRIERVSEIFEDEPKELSKEEMQAKLEQLEQNQQDADDASQ